MPTGEDFIGTPLTMPYIWRPNCALVHGSLLLLLASKLMRKEVPTKNSNFTDYDMCLRYDFESFILL